MTPFNIVSPLGIRLESRITIGALDTSKIPDLLKNKLINIIKSILNFRNPDT